MKRLPALVSALVLGALPTAALAHPGTIGHTHGFVDGVLHPLSGLDHQLAMVLVGIFAFQLGGRAIWLVPGAFMAVMALGGLVGVAGLPLPFVETGIALSAVILGIIVAFGVRAPLAVAMAMVGGFALFHGYAHGAEMPVDAAAIGYGGGFLLATGALHAVGLSLGLLVGRVGAARGRGIYRLAGGLASVTGLAILFGVV